MSPTEEQTQDCITEDFRCKELRVSSFRSEEVLKTEPKKVSQLLYVFGACHLPELFGGDHKEDKLKINRARSGCVNVRGQKNLQLVNCVMNRKGIFESHLEFV